MFRFKKISRIIIVIIATIVFSFITYYIYANNDESDVEYYSEENITKEEKVEEKTIIIHVAGCVNKPGIIKIKENSRISDAIEQAGGLTDEANVDNINLASFLEDGMKIKVLSNTDIKEEDNMSQSNTVESTNEIQNNSSKININTASINELENLPGIGTSTAKKIVEYRKENGNFNNVEDIQNVKGIGNAKYEKIKELISI